MHTFEHTIRILEEDTMHKKQTSPVMLIKQAHHRHLQLLYLVIVLLCGGRGGGGAGIFELVCHTHLFKEVLL